MPGIPYIRETLSELAQLQTLKINRYRSTSPALFQACLQHWHLRHNFYTSPLTEAQRREQHSITPEAAAATANASGARLA